VRGSRDERAAFGRQRDLLLRALYRQALDRFPFDPAFARRVIASYATRDPNDRREEARLRVRYAVLDASLVDDFVQWRAGRGRLDEDLRAVAAGRNAAERILAARLLVARSRFEEALTAARRVAVDFPADRDEVRRVADLESSLGRPNRADAARAAVRTLDGYLAVAPADETMTTRAGDLLAEAGLVDEARLRYERIAALRPADRNAWLRLATVYWDYYLFDQAALAIERARRQVGDPDFGGEKLAAVYESARQREKAVREYVRVSWRRLDRTLGWSGGGPAAEDAPEGSAARADDGPEAGEGPADPPAAELQQRSPGAEQVTERLVYLMRRHKLGPRIDQAYAAAIKAAKADPRPAAAYADYLVAANRRDEARRVWLTAIATHADRFLLERAVAVGTVDGAPGSAIVIAARRRLAALSDQAPEQVYALAAALEDAAAVEPAAAALADLAARLRGGAALDPSETAATEEKLADLFQRARRPQEALAARRRAAEALPRAPQGHSGPREAIELRLAAELARAGRPDEAMALYRSVAAQVPGDPRPLIASADVRWQRGDQSGALQDLVRAVGQAQHLPAHVRGAVVVGLRQALIGRLAEIGREREVVDQYIELINRDPTRRDLCDAAITYARTHRSLDHHLLDYYQRAAARAPKDHRWPVILAWIYERRGQPAEAARAYAQALEIAPGRLDLARARADDLAAAGQWPLAAAAYRTVYELADHDRAIRLRVAEMLGRAGHVDEARREVQGLVLGSDRPGDYVSAALCFERMGLYADARGSAESALAIALEAPRTRGFTGDWGYVYARLAARTGLAGPAFTRLMQAAGRVREDSERKGNTAAWHERGLASVLEHAARAHLAHAVAEYAGSDNALGLRQALEAWIAAGPDRRAAAAAIAEVAGLPDLSRDLYQGGLGDPRRGPRFARDLWSLFARRRDMSAAAAALERAVDLSAAERTARRAEAYRATGDEAREVAALKEHAEALGAEGRRQGLGPFATRSDLVERYLTLLARRGDRAELRRLASTPASLNGQVADFLLAHGDRELALVALATVGAAEPPVWLEVKRALALAELGDAGPTVLGPLARVLRLGPIAGVRARRTDLKREVVGARAFALTRRYGEILARSSPPAAAARYLGAAVEERPRDPAAYVDLGDRLLRLGAPALAEDAYARAQTLKGHDLEVRDRRAGAALKQGDRPRALRLWGEIIARPGAPLADHLFHARALARAGLGAEARAALAPYLERQASRLDAAALTDALRELRELYPSRAAASEWDRTLGRLLLPTERLAVLAAAVGLAPRGGEPLVDPPARGPYLERGLALLAASTDAAQRWQWRLAHLAWLLETKRLREAEARAVALLSEAGPAAPAVRVALEVARARALVRRGEVDRAVRDLVARGRAGEGAALFEAGIAMLREEQLEPRAALVTAAMYRDLVARGREDRGTLLGLSDALIKLGRREEAVVVLGRLVVREPDDNESQRLAAELLENHRMFADARGPRLTLASLRADDADNRVKLARDEIAMGLRDLGVDRALSLVAERGAPRPARLAAAVVLAEAAGADRRAAAHLADRALALDPAPPEPAAVAVALLRRLAQDPGAARAVLEAVVARAPAPARALALLGDDDLGRGRPQEAARAYERAVYYDGLTPALRRSLFGARRAAGQHDAALLALADDEVPGFLAGLPAHLGADAWLRERGARAAAALAQDGGDAVALAAAARDSARRAGERGRELYYALATTAATRGPAAAGLARDVEAMRAALRIEEDRAGRRRVSRSLDEVGLEPTPAFGAAARAPRGRR
jgi:Flp pilus assembly protein TadD